MYASVQNQAYVWLWVAYASLESNALTRYNDILPTRIKINNFTAYHIISDIYQYQPA
jgi:hypothetical protein